MGTTRAALADLREHERLVYPPGHPFRPERAIAFHRARTLPLIGEMRLRSEDP